MIMRYKKLSYCLTSLALFTIVICSNNYKIFAESNNPNFLGPKVNLRSDWEGVRKVSKGISILILAGHADSQGISGAGTSGESVDIYGAQPMNYSISDELYWNLRIRDAIVKLGKAQGLNINSYEPGIRNIDNGNDPRTNWSVGAEHVKHGGYSIEIHFDSYGEYGFGSGLIPAITPDLNLIDENLANTFGRYPIFFRGGLGAPRRGIRVLEVGKLEGKLEKRLRSLSTREETINHVAKLVINSIQAGLSQ